MGRARKPCSPAVNCKISQSIDQSIFQSISQSASSNQLNKAGQMNVWKPRISPLNSFKEDL